MLGSLASLATFGGASRRESALAATVPAQGIGSGQALLVEALVTFLLVDLPQPLGPVQRDVRTWCEQATPRTLVA